ncbi:MAG: TerC/Alx family metal homeostasis membrane protein [Bacteroidetes bacterium]|nr:TerC/Alx family metal homeostasis membrane protein [Bacteroidota bacterium]
MNLNEIIFFTGFLVVIFVFLFIDLKIAGRDSHVISFKEAILWTLIWVFLSLSFFFLIYFFGHLIHGINDKAGLLPLVDRYEHSINISNPALSYTQALTIYQHNLGLEYFTGYLIEYSLSVDNVFIMILIFTAFGIQPRYYHRILFWGILGAVIMRFIFIFLSATLIQRFEWILYLFGAFLVFTGVQMFIERNKEKKVKTEDHPMVKFSSRFFKVKSDYKGSKFFLKEHRQLWITPLFIVLLVIEFTDLIFAVDSVPAIFAVTKDPYIVFFSNIFAILGLRSLFFVVSNVMQKFHYLKEGLSVLLTFIGVKMLVAHWVNIPTSYSLLVVIGILAVAIFASVLFPKQKTAGLH